MYNYEEYKKLKQCTPTCGECRFFIPESEKCIKLVLKHTEEHINACKKYFDSHYEG